MTIRVFLMFSAIALLSTPVTVSSAPAAQAATTSAEDVALIRLFEASDEAALERNPVNALFRGDTRFADRYGDYISDTYFAGERAAGEADLKALAAIDRRQLSPTNQIAYDVFAWQTRLTLKSYAPDMLALTITRPIDHFYGIHTYYPGIASGDGAASFKTFDDYENNLKRHRDYIANLDASIARFREGMASGVVQPKLVVRNVIEQLETQLAPGVERSTFYSPVTQFPDDLARSDRVRLRKQYTAIIRDGIFPAYRRLRDFLKNDYLPIAREGVGLRDMKGGDWLYAALIEQHTTLPLSADEVHNLGLSEVARITTAMEVIKQKVGFDGTLAQFFEYRRNDPQFKPPSAEWLRDTYFAIGKRVDARVREQFALIPKTPLEIRAVEPWREKNEAAGSYQQGAPDGSRPGLFYYNTYDLPSRTTPGMETLYLHEAVPGHHFQVSLAQENSALPAFMRFGGNTAYVEGWALYAETLWAELGMENDLYQRFGGLDDEMLRAMRLVVDTGIHAKGWGRDQAIDYMLSHSGMGKTDATAEVERYIAIPGQALAYKIGQLTILKLKAKAQAALGLKFDPRAFHAQILDSGALPMTILEAKIEAWIKAQKGA